jgi:hypothetical protein
MSKETFEFFNGNFTIAQYLAHQATTDCFSCMDRHYHATSILVLQEMMASFYPDQFKTRFLGLMICSPDCLCRGLRPFRRAEEQDAGHSDP